MRHNTHKILRFTQDDTSHPVIASAAKQYCRVTPFLAMTIFLLFTTNPAHAQSAGDACTNANQVARVQGPAGAGLVCNGTTLEVYESVLTGPLRHGIGIANPLVLLHIGGTPRMQGDNRALLGLLDFSPMAADVGGGIELDGMYTSGGLSAEWAGIKSGKANGISGDYGAYMAFMTRTNGSLTAERMRIDDMGKVGIGTATPAAKLDVNGEVKVGNTALACAAGTAGAVRYNNGTLEICNGTVWGSVTITYQPCSASPIGTVCPDGTVYAGLSPDGNVPMYAMPTDSSTSIAWDDGTGNSPDSGMYEAISNITGRANTTTLAGLSNPGSPFQAAQLCQNLAANGKSDWYLPAQDELNILYVNKAAVGNFAATVYWSSTTFNGNTGRWQDFSDGTQGYDGGSNSNPYYVRCVRRD